MNEVLSDILIIIGLVISFGATIVLLVFAIRQWRVQQSVKNVPLRYEEWHASYKTKRTYIAIAQLAGIAIALIGAVI